MALRPQERRPLWWRLARGALRAGLTAGAALIVVLTAFFAALSVMTLLREVQSGAPQLQTLRLVLITALPGTLAVLAAISSWSGPGRWFGPLRTPLWVAAAGLPAAAIYQGNLTGLLCLLAALLLSLALAWAERTTRKPEKISQDPRPKGEQ